MKWSKIRGIALVSACALVISSTVYADLLNIPSDPDTPVVMSDGNTTTTNSGSNEITRTVDELAEATRANVKPIGVINGTTKSTPEGEVNVEPYSEIPTSAMMGTFEYDQDDDGVAETRVNTYEFQNYLNKVYSNLSQEIDTNNSEIQTALDSSVTDIREHLNYLSGVLIDNDNVLADKISYTQDNSVVVLPSKTGSTITYDSPYIGRSSEIMVNYEDTSANITPVYSVSGDTLTITGLASDTVVSNVIVYPDYEGGDIPVSTPTP